MQTHGPTKPTLCSPLLLLCLLCVTSTGAAAARHNQYPFDDPSDYLTGAANYSPWATTLQRHRQQRAELLACAPDARCRGRLRSFNRMLEKARGLSVTEQIELVNFYINRTRYDNDHPQRLYDSEGNKIGVERNHWATLLEFLTERGDCEDYASAKYFMLRELGLPAEQMRVVVTREFRPRGYHAVLAIRLDNSTVWLLESDNVIKKRNHSGYSYVYAMNEQSVWDHREDYQPEVKSFKR